MRWRCNATTSWTPSGISARDLLSTRSSSGISAKSSPLTSVGVLAGAYHSSMDGASTARQENAHRPSHAGQK